ncbi:MAG TPA: hypothetical protein VG839_04970 [Asticcacaulis sp.]|nr:hypothetical protein [Asticcacaulis sp.]
MTNALVKSVYLMVPAAAAGLAFASVPGIAQADEISDAWAAYKAAEATSNAAEGAILPAYNALLSADRAYDACLNGDEPADCGTQSWAVYDAEAAYNNAQWAAMAAFQAEADAYSYWYSLT